MPAAWNTLLAPCVVAAILTGAGAASQATAEISTLKSVSVDLPSGDRMFPDGPGADAINNNCLACHSAGMVLNQAALPGPSWAAIVHKMISVYKAPVSAEDASAITTYLTRLKGSSAPTH